MKRTITIFLLVSALLVMTACEEKPDDSYKRNTSPEAESASSDMFNEDISSATQDEPEPSEQDNTSSEEIDPAASTPPTAESQENKESLHKAFKDASGGANELYFLYYDYDGDGVNEAFGITGNESEELCTGVSIYYISADGKCKSIADGESGMLSTYLGKDVLDTGSRRFVVWCHNVGGSTSSSYIYGVKGGDVYEPSVSGKYDYFSPALGDNRYTAEMSDRSQGYLDHLMKSFTFDAASGEFKEVKD